MKNSTITGKFINPLKIGTHSKSSKVIQQNKKDKEKNKEINAIFKPFILSKNIINNIKTEYKNSFFNKLNYLHRNFSEQGKKVDKTKLNNIFRDTYLLKNHSVITNTNTSTNYYDVIKSQISKKSIIHNRSLDSHLNTISSKREKKYEEKKNNLMEKLKEKQEKINKIKKINKIMNINQTKDNMNKTEMKLIKVKLHKILKENNNKICNKFESKNYSFNKRLKKFFKSEKYIKGIIMQENNFSPNKKDFYSSHDLSDFYFDLDSNLYNDEEYITRAVVNSFTDREKSIICLSPKYFAIHKNKPLIKKLKIDPNEKLKDKLQKEENMEKYKNKNSNDIYLGYNSTKNNDKKIINSFKKKSNIKKKIDKLKRKKIQEEMKKTNKEHFKDKNKISDYFNKEIKNYYSQYHSFCGKNKLKYNSWKGSDDYYKMFNYPINYNMTRESLIDKNNERLDKEEYFHQLRDKNKTNNDYINNTISKYQSLMMKNYK